MEGVIPVVDADGVVVLEEGSVGVVAEVEDGVCVCGVVVVESPLFCLLISHGFGGDAVAILYTLYKSFQNK